MAQLLKFSDGSLHHDVPIDILRESLGIRFAIVSQVNPHVVPFFQAGSFAQQHWQFFHRIPWYFGECMRMRARIVRNLGFKPRVAGIDLFHVITQTYHGDVTILPSSMATFNDYLGVLDSLSSKDELDKKIRLAETLTSEHSLIWARMRIQRAVQRFVDHHHSYPFWRRPF